MVPIRLTLQNFMSYGADVAPIDLTGMHTFCLSGENGHGKSALFDAMTWALWGESRAGKNKHDDLVRIGADEMSVEFVFEMDGQQYRVLRKRSKRASGSLWELHQTTDVGGWRALTGNTALETEKVLLKLLRMSYDTFINSAFLRQGNADLFVRHSPGKRKEILADILDLSRYDRLEAKARERTREAAAEVAELERDIRLLEAQLAAEPELRASAAALQVEAAELATQQAALKADGEQVKARKSELAHQQKMRDALQSQITSLEREAADLGRDLAEQEAEIKRYQALLVREPEICRNYAALEETKAQVQTLEAAVANLHRLRQAQHETEKKWLAAKGEIQRQVERADGDYTAARARLKGHDALKAQHEELTGKIKRVGVLEARKKELTAALAAAREEFARLRELSVAFKEKETQWQARIDSLVAKEGRCITCNAPLSPERMAQARAEYQAELDKAKGERNTVSASGRTVKDDVTKLEQESASLDAELGELVNIQIRHGQLEQQLRELETIAREVPKLESVRDQARKTLTTEVFAPEVRVEVLRLAQEIAVLSTAESDYTGAKQRLTGLTGAERLYIDLQNAKSANETAEARRIRTQASLQQRQAAREDLAKQVAALQDCSAELAVLDRRLAEIMAQETANLDQERKISREIGRIEESLARCEVHKVERVTKQEALLTARVAQEEFDQLTKAFGKKGVQALIIENAIPEIQDEANRILQKLSDGDLSVFFETVREGKAKRDAPIETLDIKVSDNLGTRPLEMYSGGEAFRVAFALRIALSKLLAKRAGARLQTLIIDEGFGTQDGKGREKLVEALQALRDDFDKIIVITHIDELKDAFSSRVEVIKGSGGSQVTVYEGFAG